MIEIEGELWDFYGDSPIVITTATVVGKKGTASMPRGCAAQAKKRIPELPSILGRLIMDNGPGVYEMMPGLICFPVERSPMVFPEMSMIRSSSRELRKLVDQNGWGRVIVPRPGCGSGGLRWKDVKPVLADYFDDRFWVINAPNPVQRA